MVVTSSLNVMPPLTARGASLEFKGELKRCPILNMVCDKECLILLHRLRQFLKIGLSELSGQKICPAPPDAQHPSSSARGDTFYTLSMRHGCSLLLKNV